MYVNKGGYAELIQFPGSNVRLEKEAAAVKREMRQIDGLSLGFTLSAKAVTTATGGLPEEHPPLCPVMVEGMQKDLDDYKAAAREEILNAARPEVQAFISLGF